MTERPPRILMVVGPATGGIGAHAASLAHDIAAGGARVAVVCPELTAERFTWRVPVEVAWPDGGPVVRWRAWRRLRALAGTADVVHAQGHQAGVLALLAVRRARPRPAVVVSWHNAVLGRGVGRWLRGLAERWQARHADIVTGASTDLVERARALGARRAEIAPVAAPRAGEEPLGTDARHRLRAALGIAPEGPVVLTVSRIAPQKNLEMLVAAARHLDGVAAAHGHPGRVTWLVAGDGDPDLAESLREQIARTGVDVRLLGARDDVPALLAAADVFALPSRWEARALVLQEAMAAGVPVVATAVGGIPELLAGSGLLVPNGDARAFARAVANILRDPDLRERLSEAGRRRAADLPGASDVTRSWAQRYAGLGAQTPRLR